MDAESFGAYVQNELQMLQHAGLQRSHGTTLTIGNSHDAQPVAVTSRAQQPAPLILPQLQNPPLSTPKTPSTPVQTPAGIAGQQHQQPLLIQVPIESANDPSNSNPNNPNTPHQQIQIQAQMEAGVLPTAEEKARYDAARKELIQAIQKKRAVDRALAQLEVQIYNFEGSYLTETANSGGNIIQGFESYLKAQNVSRRKHDATDADRVFSNSSLTYQKSIELMENEEPHNGSAYGGGGFGDDSTLGHSSSAHGISASSSNGAGGRGLTPGITTVVLPAPMTRVSVEHAPMTAAQQKKARDKEYQRRKRANAAHMRSQQQAAQANGQRDSVGFGRETSTDGGDDGGSVSARASSRRPNKRQRGADDD